MIIALAAAVCVALLVRGLRNASRLIDDVLAEVGDAPDREAAA